MQHAECAYATDIVVGGRREPSTSSGRTATRRSVRRSASSRHMRGLLRMKQRCAVEPCEVNKLPAAGGDNEDAGGTSEKMSSGEKIGAHSSSLQSSPTAASSGGKEDADRWLCCCRWWFSGGGRRCKRDRQESEKERNNRQTRTGAKRNKVSQCSVQK